MILSELNYPVITSNVERGIIFKLTFQIWDFWKSLDLLKIIKYYVRVKNQTSIRFVWITGCYWLLKVIWNWLSGLTNMLNISIIRTFYQWTDGAMERDKHQQVSSAGEKSLKVWVCFFLINISLIKHSPGPSHHHHHS